MSEQNNRLSYSDAVSLKEFFESKLAYIDKALTVAKESMDKRLDMSEGKFITRTEFDFQQREINSLKESRAELKGKASHQSVIISYVIALVSITVSVVTLIIRIIR